jgi:hypothetical protein
MRTLLSLLFIILLKSKTETITGHANMFYEEAIIVALTHLIILTHEKNESFFINNGTPLLCLIYSLLFAL